MRAGPHRHLYILPLRGRKCKRVPSGVPKNPDTHSGVWIFLLCWVELEPFNASVRWTDARSRLDGIDTSNFSPTGRNCKRVPSGICRTSATRKAGPGIAGVKTVRRTVFRPWESPLTSGRIWYRCGQKSEYTFVSIRDNRFFCFVGWDSNHSMQQSGVCKERFSYLPVKPSFHFFKIKFEKIWL